MGNIITFCLSAFTIWKKIENFFRFFNLHLTTQNNWRFVWSCFFPMFHSKLLGTPCIKIIKIVYKVNFPPDLTSSRYLDVFLWLYQGAWVLYAGWVILRHSYINMWLPILFWTTLDRAFEMTFDFLSRSPLTFPSLLSGFLYTLCQLMILLLKYFEIQSYL
jgi:hypothetical protein